MRNLAMIAAAIAFLASAGLSPALAADTNTTSPWGGGPGVKGDETGGPPGDEHKTEKTSKAHKGGKKGKKGSGGTTTQAPK